MKFNYYPGCTLKTKAKELDAFGRKSLEALGVDFEEIKEWQCCGAVYPVAKDEVATKLSAVRTLAMAKENGGKVLTLCSACHNVLKRVNNDMKTDENMRLKANNYLALEEPYLGESEVIHYLELLRDYVGFDKIKAAVVNPLKGVKIGAYYGCLLLRPNSTMAFDNPENPTIIEDFIKAIGATPVVYAFRNECCGAYVSTTNNELAKKKSSAVIASAKDEGAEMLVTACPLCMYNLRQNGGGEIEVKYFTELLATALGVNN
ncbi:MAG: CoB--CoM heterodisulfide reductase iron-sulfur subunit B family protein [Clostridia bacterium]|nr:CoB--CoM heterodisulfide reductase iron-sulfur subunit B family protein [Clostridia bacterium]